jgi:lipoprotein signal peptidase
MVPPEGQPTFLLFGMVASVSLLLDVASKAWAEVTLINRPTTPITLIEDHLALTLAYNPGGAWGHRLWTGSWLSRHLAGAQESQRRSGR